jgi:K+/H+ antiporter YhaU regulatory subunit KhtT
MERARARPLRAQVVVGLAWIFGSSATIVGIAAIYEIAWRRLDQIAAADIGINLATAAILVRVIAVGLSIAPGFGIWRGAHRIARAVAPEFATSDHSADRMDAPYVLSQVLELAIIFATVLLLVAAIAPFVQPGETVAMLLAAVAIIATMIWRSAHSIQRHLEEVARTLTAMRLPTVTNTGANHNSDHERPHTPLIPVRLTDDATVIGKSLAELNLPPGSAVVALSRDGAVIIPDETEVLRAGDTLALVGGRDALALARNLLQSHRSEISI